MAFVYMGVIFFATIAAVAFIKSLNLGLGLSATILIPLFLLVIYCLARVQPKEPKSDKDSNK